VRISFRKPLKNDQNFVSKINEEKHFLVILQNFRDMKVCIIAINRIKAKNKALKMRKQGEITETQQLIECLLP